MIELDALNELAGKYADAKKGDMIVYHTGYLSLDRDISNKTGESKTCAMEVGSIADYFWNHHKNDKVHLVQKRNPLYFDAVRGPFIHDYIAIKC